MAQIGMTPKWGGVGVIQADRGGKFPCSYRFGKYKEFYPLSPRHCSGFVEFTLEQVEAGEIVPCDECGQKYELRISG
jgi:hypothetical protein